MIKRPLVLLISILLFDLPLSVLAQVNSWTNATSGNWDDPYWSLGELPGTNQDIMLRMKAGRPWLLIRIPRRTFRKP